MKIIVAHPYKQHSFKTAEGLLENGTLYAYITSVYLRNGNLTEYVYKHVGKNNRKRAETHQSAMLNKSVIQFDEIGGLLMTLMRRIPITNRIVPKVDLIFFKHFGIKVAKYAIREKVDAVIMYDTTAMWCFKYLKEYAENIKCILDMSAITLDGQEKSFDHDSNLCTTKWHTKHINKKLIENGLKEIKLADSCVVASEYTMYDLVDHGVSKEKIYVVPYGYEQEKLKNKIDNEPKTPLKILYVGRITYEKGVHHLLSALQDIDAHYLELTLAGDYTANSKLYEEYKEKCNYKFLGFVTKDHLYDIYQKNDVLIVPSLSDGYGLVVLEGMSCGLPVIASTCTGAASIIKDKVNGIKYDAYSEQDLRNAVMWFVHNINQLPKMKQAAKETIIPYTWENYYEGVVTAVDHIVQGEKT